jgi:hypothetical protein
MTRNSHTKGLKTSKNYTRCYYLHQNQAHLDLLASKDGRPTIGQKRLASSGLKHIADEIGNHRVQRGRSIHEHACPDVLVHERHFAICTQSSWDFDCVHKHHFAICM